MRTRFLQFVTLSVLLITDAHSQLIHDLKELVDSSDLIVIARIAATRQVDVGTAVLSGHTFPMVTERATLEICEQLKGEVPNVVDVQYPLLRPSAGWTGGLPKDFAVIDSMAPNSERMVFLKKSGDEYRFTDLRTQSIEVGGDACNSRKGSAVGPYEKVISTFVSVLDSDASTEIKGRIVMQLGAVESPDVLAALHHLAKQSQDPPLRMEAVTSILLHKDDSVLELAEEELLSPVYPWGAKSNLLIAIRSAVDPARSIPILAKGLSIAEPQVRTRAAEALYGTNSPDAIKPLLSALEDPDKQVQFAVMQGLGNLTHEYEWRPSTVDPDSTSWNACLNHWRQFRESSHW